MLNTSRVFSTRFRYIGLNFTTRILHQTREFGTSVKMADKITNWVAPNDKSGEFKRGQSQFRNFIQKGGEFPPEKGRYHLYVSYACPWAHRALIVRQLKGLQEIIPFTSVHWHMQEKGWHFASSPNADNSPGENVRPDPVPGHENYTHIRDVYFQVDPEYKGRFTVPTLYDVKQGKIVSNESSEIIRMFYTEFDDLLAPEYKNVSLFPSALQSQIEATNEWTYNDINNGVYKSGFATTQEAYEKAVTTLFSSLDKVEKHLSEVKDGPFYYGKDVTEADIRLFTTVVRFDVVYVQHFKTNIRTIRADYPYIHKWLRNLYWTIPAFKDTTEFTHIKNHYTKSHTQINPFSITPLGPQPPILGLDEEVAAVKWALAQVQGKK
ncbi:related to ECM4 protein (involved in cell wall biogenesis and architecture) [Rhynchosporium graminicola]|uniref:Related to ECM4 protein (Involved in cell wall biogenesis and architecture) n=1 Tax=Rhynchosporium graminicola TaxID=2792576 RepID=A0A1E1KSV4_9HELO|nr:related to ECM4 protein (involved in cell wall biogenesis and architecture) [Rhynchosporium commune]